MVQKQLQIRDVRSTGSPRGPQRGPMKRAGAERKFLETRGFWPMGIVDCFGERDGFNLSQNIRVAGGAGLGTHGFRRVKKLFRGATLDRQNLSSDVVTLSGQNEAHTNLFIILSLSYTSLSVVCFFSC